MAFTMNFSRESMSGKPPVPDGKYTLRCTGFEPKIAGENKDSISLNPKLEIVNNPEYNGRRIFENLNTKGSWIIQDFVHACGLQMAEVQDGNQGTEAASYTLPGVWINADQNPDDPSKWEYQGPLTNATFDAEVYTSEYKGKKSNKVKQYFCTIPGCVERHSTNLAG